MVLSYLRRPSSKILNTPHCLSPLTQTLGSVLKDFLKKTQLHSTKVEQMAWVCERTKKSEISHTVRILYGGSGGGQKTSETIHGWKILSY